MAVENVSRWAWVLIGAGVGLLIDQVHRLPQGSWTEQYSQSVGQANFEAALRKPPGMPRGFINLTIYPEWVKDADGSAQRVYVIVGDYDQNVESRNRPRDANRSRRCFVAETPYRPIQKVGLSTGEFPSVLDYLAELKRSDGEISYHYIWWHQSKWSTAFWVTAGVLVIGIIWPTLINFLVFHSLRRPRVAGIDLSKAASTASAPAVVASSTADGAVIALIDDIQAELKGADTPSAASPAAAASVPVPALSGQTAPAASAAPEAHAEFGQKPDDFYPTERRAGDHHDANGFSLVELLVVMGIISLLVAILMPVLAATREHAKQLKCETTLRAIGQAAELHVLEHHGYLPLVGRQFNPIDDVLNPAGVGDSEEKRYDYYVDNGQKRPMPVTGALALSLGAKLRLDSREHLTQDMSRDDVRKLFRCASQDVQPQSYSISDTHGWKGPDEWSSYIFNEAIMGRRDKTWNFPQGSIAAVHHTETLMMAMDGKPRGSFSVFDGNQNFTMYDFRIWVAQQPRLGNDVLDYPRHHYRANVLFLDGHVANLPLTEGGIRRIGISNGIYN